MIQVTPIEKKEDQEALAALCGVPFHTEWLAYRAIDDGVFAGICQFNMNAEGGHIYHLAAPLAGAAGDALFVMGRAALNFIDLCGVKTAYFDGEGVSDALLRRIGFLPDANGRYTVSLDGFFDHPCAHHAH